MYARCPCLHIYIYIYADIYICACMHYVHKPVKPSPNNNCPPFSIYSALPVFPCRARLPLVSIVMLVMNPSPGFILRLPQTPPNTPYTSHNPPSSSLEFFNDSRIHEIHRTLVVHSNHLDNLFYTSLINATISLRRSSITPSPRLSPTRSLGPNTPKSNLSFLIAASTSNIGCIG